MAKTLAPIKKTSEDTDRIAAIASGILDRGDSLIYAVVGGCFFLAAIFTLGYSFWDFGSSISHINNAAKDTTPQSIAANAIIKMISDLLLVLIIMEVLGTVVQYLKSHTTSLRPFLFIGIISATRGILSIGARLSVKEVSGPEFTSAMVEMGISAAVILALGITLKLLGKAFDE